MNGQKQTLSISVLLVLLGFVVFGQVYGFDFVHYDDPAYITENRYVSKGITVDGLKWAVLHQETGAPLRFPGVNNIYHPLSLVSHMVDVELFGLNYGAHHVMNLFLHLVATVFAFLFIRSLAGSYWVGFVGAALFLVHPTHVESVAWLSERKDTLSGLFFWGALYFYFSVRRKSLGFVCLMLGLLAKPSLVVLPVLVVLIVCYFSKNKFKVSNLVKEVKGHWHWFAVAFVFGVINLYTQSSGTHAFFSGETSLMTRVQTVGSGYWFYLYRTLVPVDLSVAYPIPAIGRLHYVALYAMVSLFVWAWFYRNRFPLVFLAIAWFTVCWLPVSGVTYIAIDFTADRYLYLSLGGFFILVGTWLSKTSLGKVASVLIVLGCAYLSFLQTQVWENTHSLFKHATVAQPKSTMGWTNLGSSYQLRGEYDEAIRCHETTIDLNPMDYISYHNLGICCYNIDEKERSREYFLKAIELYPAHFASLNSLSQMTNSKEDFIQLGELVNKAHDVAPRDRRIVLLKEKVEEIRVKMR